MLRLKRSLALLLALCLSGLSLGCSARTVPQPTLTLWYAESECSRAAMTAMLEDYRQQTGAVVDAVAFADETALGAAFETGQPDLLFCSLDRAARMDALQPLPTLAVPGAYDDAVTGASPLIAGGSFFPIGACLPLLLSDPALTGADFGDLESLLDAAAEAGSPFLGADCWADLLYQGMFSLGRELTGVEKADLRDADYCALYNRLASCAYDGGLARVEDSAAAYVRQGLLPCAVIDSSALSSFDPDGLRVQPLPPAAGGRAVWSAELVGFVPLNAGSGADALLTWLLTEDRAPALALAAGFAPVQDSDLAPESGSCAALLLSLWTGSSLRFRPAGTDYALNRGDCEQRLRRHLDLLA